jgi:hypothetical protein
MEGEEIHRSEGFVKVVWRHPDLACHSVEVDTFAVIFTGKHDCQLHPAIEFLAGAALHSRNFFLLCDCPASQLDQAFCDVTNPITEAMLGSSGLPGREKREQVYAKTAGN